MRQAFLGLCVFAVACSSQPPSLTSPSAVANVVRTQTQAKGGANIEVTFTKWIDPAFPAFVGVAGGDVPGDFAATVLDRDAFDNGNIVKLEARYSVIADNPAHSFVAHIEGTQNKSDTKGCVEWHRRQRMADGAYRACDLRCNRTLPRIRKSRLLHRSRPSHAGLCSLIRGSWLLVNWGP